MNVTYEQTFHNCRWQEIANLDFIPVQFVDHLIEIVEEENVLLQNGDGLNGASHALTDAIMGRLQCCVLYLSLWVKHRHQCYWIELDIRPAYTQACVVSKYSLSC